jgi:protein-S-isoprenylcysteine O-methyltransferase Ste14
LDAKRRRNLITTVTGALVGAFVGARLVRGGSAPDLAPGVATSPMAVGFYCWMAISVYWAWAARNVSEVRSEESSASRALHVLLYSAAQVLGLWPFAGWPFAEARVYAFPLILPFPSVRVPLGLILAVGGTLFAIWSRRQLGRNWSGAVTIKVDHELIRSGPYRYIRHPIYTGLLALYLGVALISGRLQGVLSVALVSIGYARKIRQEERALRDQFGTAWDDYRRHTRALL